MRILDEVDFSILNLLQHNAEISHKELASRINRSTPTVYERVRRLKEDGYIERTVAILNRKKISKGLLAFSQVLLNDHTAKTLDTFAHMVTKFPEVMECFQMSGTCDFLLRIVTDDMDSYLDVYKRLGELPSITTITSFFVLSEIKSETAYKL
jgi:Lrp/AsnC family transcriptional regulator, leucine-responsive regulatory protein